MRFRRDRQPRDLGGQRSADRGARSRLRGAPDRRRAEERAGGGERSRGEVARCVLTVRAAGFTVLSPRRTIMRAEWVERRRGLSNVTQMHFARQGVVTEEMQHVARREKLPAELIRAEVARGRMIIPANL